VGSEEITAAIKSLCDYSSTQAQIINKAAVTLCAPETAFKDVTQKLKALHAKNPTIIAPPTITDFESQKPPPKRTLPKRKSQNPETPETSTPNKRTKPDELPAKLVLNFSK
jgi:hypothetical protein